MPTRARKILADLDRVASAFDMTQDGLGESLFKAFTDGVKGSIAAEQSPDGKGWDQLDPEYEAWKSKAYPGQPMGFLEDIMTAPEEFEGEPEITPSEATLTFGKSQEAKDHASWFQNGDEENNQPPRPFWGFTPASRAAVKSILAARLKKAVNG